MPIPTLDEVDRQLTARRLEGELLQKRITELVSIVQKQQLVIDSLQSTTVTTVQSSDLDSALSAGSIIHQLPHIFRKIVTFVSSLIITGLTNQGIVTADSSSKLVNSGNFKWDGQTVTNTFAGQTLYKAVDSTDSVTAGMTAQSNGANFGSFTAHDTIIFTANTYDCIHCKSTGEVIIQNDAAGKLSFFAGTPIVKQVLSAYTTDPESSSYSGIASGVGGTPYAQVADLNSLRVAYENIRAAYDDLRTKLKNTTLVG